MPEFISVKLRKLKRGDKLADLPGTTVAHDVHFLPSDPPSAVLLLTDERGERIDVPWRGNSIRVNF